MEGGEIFEEMFLRISVVSHDMFGCFALIAIIGKIVPDTIGEPMTVGAAMGAVTAFICKTWRIWQTTQVRK